MCFVYPEKKTVSYGWSVRLGADKSVDCLKYLPVGFQWRTVNLCML